MNKKQQEGNDTSKLLQSIIDGIEEKKGIDIVKIDLTKIDYSESKYFVICQGNSTVQANSIAQSVEETVEKETGETAWHKDGYKNSIWILLDYGDVMVHVFQKDARAFYNIENLWADAKIEKIETTIETEN